MRIARGLLGYVACFSETLRDALRRLQRYGRVFTEAVEFRLPEGRPQVALAACHPALGPGHALAQDYRLAAVLKMSREITGVDIVPTEVEFHLPSAVESCAAPQLFRCPLHFGAPAASIVFRTSDSRSPACGSRRDARRVSQQVRRTGARITRAGRNHATHGACRHLVAARRRDPVAQGRGRGAAHAAAHAAAPPGGRGHVAAREKSKRFARPWLSPSCAIVRWPSRMSPFSSGTPSRAPSSDRSSDGREPRPVASVAKQCSARSYRRQRGANCHKRGARCGYVPTGGVQCHCLARRVIVPCLVTPTWRWVRRGNDDLDEGNQHDTGHEALCEQFSTLPHAGGSRVRRRLDRPRTVLSPRSASRCSQPLDTHSTKWLVDPVTDFVAEEFRDAVRRRQAAEIDGRFDAVAVLKDGRRLHIEVVTKIDVIGGRPARISLLRDVTRAEAGE